MDKLEVLLTITSNYHPQSNGNWLISKNFLFREPRRLGLVPPIALVCTELLAQFQCVLGYQAPLCPWNANSSNLPCFNNWFEKREQVWERMH